MEAADIRVMRPKGIINVSCFFLSIFLLNELYLQHGTTLVVIEDNLRLICVCSQHSALTPCKACSASELLD